MIDIERSAPHGQPPAEGETAVTVPIVGRIDIRRIHVQVVGISTRVGGARPVVAVVADVVDVAIREVEIPATDKS